jgi:hypothetical protein
MDAKTFDHLTAAAARRPNRRGALRLLAGGLVGALLTRRGIAPLGAAQRSDRDGDGLFDDDEVAVYGTNPDLFDTDRDGTGDGEEIYNRDNGLGGPSDPLTPAGGGGGTACPAGQFDCGAGCTDLNSDAGNCGICGLACDVANGHSCVGGFCTRPAAPPPAAPPAAPTCIALGGQCVGIDLPCCGNDPTLGYNNVLCCLDLTGAGYCTDVTGRFLCPDPGVPAAGCPGGMIDCGGFCTDVLTDHGNCGFCGNACPFGSNCTNGKCAVVCPPGQTDCGYCTDLQTDPYSCGTCHNLCDSGVCDGGYCFHTCWGWGVGCDEDRDCCSGDCGLDEFLGTGVCV